MMGIMSEGNTCAPTTHLRWTEEETRALINVVSDLGVMSRLDRPKQRNQHVYQQVVNALSRRGTERTVPQARDKFKKLKQSYLQERARRCRSGEAGQSRFRFWEEMNGLLGRRPVAAAHLTGTSQHAAPEASSSCLNQGRRNARPSQCSLVTEYRRSSLLEMRLMRRQMQVAAARQQFLFQQAERRRRHDWSRWMRQQQHQHQQTVAMFSEFLHSIAEAATSHPPAADVVTDPAVASPGRTQDGGQSIRCAGPPPREAPVPGEEEVSHNCNM
ncbi:Zinc finger and SCAN domain-containing protein 29 [Acipenser ruthenus]|uniref:Zinc finger and SCAN domain-containing protein 29 n=1 Tax=Acipenser ruthenus TaxID=7906 RepID=A0A444URN3_ACIRT|nr:Zinc finger and SCAN domain-containing protein 29 [Acipenser ruthenus]